MKPLARELIVGLLLAIIALPAPAAAHDDPVVTVRVLCNGFNALDMDTVLGELSESANLSVDRDVHGAKQIEQWVKDEMDHDLRIEILDMGTPQQSGDGYTLVWIGRFSRQDWRASGSGSREVSNTMVMRNGRITAWTATMNTQSAVDESIARSAGTTLSSETTGMPQIGGIPISLVFGGLIVLVGGILLLRAAIRR